MITALAVNAPGFPIAREAIAAAAMPMLADVHTAGYLAGGVPTALVASGIVTRCPECQKRMLEEQGLAARSALSAMDVALAELQALRRDMATLERRTRHLVHAEAEAATRRILKSPS